MIMICVGTGTTKEGADYSKLVPVVKTAKGDEYLDLKRPQYLDRKVPLLKKFSNELKEA